MKIISLGGICGCELAKALRKLNQPAYPYDWLITTQSFVIRSFNNFKRFFNFDDESYLYKHDKLIDENKKAIMLHDFQNYDAEKSGVVQKYKRRFERLNQALSGDDESILFVRICDNVEEPLTPNNYYNNILTREKEDYWKWNEFIQTQETIYNKKMKLLLITNNAEHKNLNELSHVKIFYTPENNTTNDKICEIIWRIKIYMIYQK